MRMAAATMIVGLVLGAWGWAMLSPAPDERDYRAGFHDGVEAAIDYLKSLERKD